MPQARAALKQYKDVMQAAERIFEGKFDHLAEDDDDQTASTTRREDHAIKEQARMIVRRF